MNMDQSQWRKPNVNEKAHIRKKLMPDALLNTILYGILAMFLIIIITLFIQMYFERRTTIDLIITVVVVIPMAIFTVLVGKITFNYSRRISCLKSGEYLVAVTYAEEIRASLALKRTIDNITFKAVDDRTWILPSNGFFKAPVETGQKVWLIDYNNQKKGSVDYLQVP